MAFVGVPVAHGDAMRTDYDRAWRVSAPDDPCGACGVPSARHGTNGRTEHWFVAPRHPERAPAIAVDFSRSSPNEVAPAAALTPPTLIGEAPLASAPTRHLDYPEAARVIALYLEEFCDQELRYPDMIADAARKAAASLQSERLARETAEQRLALALMELGHVPDPRTKVKGVDVRELQRGDRPFSPRDPRPLTPDEVRAAVAAPHPETRP